MQERNTICRQAKNADAMEIAAKEIRAGIKKSLPADAALHRFILVEEEEIADRLGSKKKPFNRKEVESQTDTQTREGNRPYRHATRG